MALITVKNIVWDFDGTIADVYCSYAKSLLKLLSQKGINSDFDQVYLALRKHSVSYALKFYFGESSREVAPVYKKIRNAAAIKEATPMNGIEGILQKTKVLGINNYLYTINSSFALDCLKKWNIDCFFKDFITSENGFPKKPDPSALLYLFQKCHLSKNDTIMIGDREIDVESAHNAGIKSVLFDCDGFFPDTKAEFYISNLSLIDEILFF